MKRSIDEMEFIPAKKAPDDLFLRIFSIAVFFGALTAAYLISHP